MEDKHQENHKGRQVASCDLTFMGPCIVIIILISNEMQLYTVYFIWKLLLHVSGGTSTHPQERKRLHLQHLVLVTP